MWLQPGAGIIISSPRNATESLDAIRSIRFCDPRSTRQLTLPMDLSKSSQSAGLNCPLSLYAMNSGGSALTALVMMNSRPALSGIAYFGLVPVPNSWNRSHRNSSLSPRIMLPTIVFPGMITTSSVCNAAWSTPTVRSTIFLIAAAIINLTCLRN